MLLLLLACMGGPEPELPAPEPTTDPAPAPSDPAVGPLEATAPPTARLETYREMWADLGTARHPADGGGRVWKTGGPDEVEAGTGVQLELTYEVGPLGIAEGGTVHFLPSPFWGWTPPQAELEEAPGYTVIDADVPGVRLEASARGRQLAWTVRGGSLPAGARLRWVYGAGPARAQVDRFAERESALWVSVDGDGDGVRQVVASPATVTVRAGPPVRLHATLPSTAEPGARVQLTVAALDALGNAFRGVDGPVALELPDTVQGPSQITLSDEGLATVPLVVSKPGVVVARVTGADGVTGTSNPLVSRPGIEPVLWGDLQIHSGLSDGTGVPSDVYRYARDVAALDVAAITDHDHWGMRFLDASADYRARLEQATEAANEPGRFVAVHGFEWTNWVHGHRHVLGFDGPVPILSSLDPATDTPAELWAALRGREVLTIAHHSAGGPVATDWSFRPDPELEPITEIASVHGQSEDPSTPGVIYDAVPGNFVVDQLRAGVRVGFVGSTDGHDGHPGLSHLAGGKGGLVALVGAEATRASVLETLRARRTYATNGVRMLLRVEVGGQPMGSVLPAGDAEQRVVVRVVGTAPLDRLELVRRSGVVGSVQGEGRQLLHHTWTLGGLPSGDFVYVRALQLDGGVAWSSPVFVE